MGLALGGLRRAAALTAHQLLSVQGREQKNYKNTCENFTIFSTFTHIVFSAASLRGNDPPTAPRGNLSIEMATTEAQTREFSYCPEARRFQ